MPKTEHPIGFVPAGHVEACAFGDGLALLDLKSNEYFALNEVGSILWRGLARGDSLRAVQDAVVAEFEVDAARCLADLKELLGDLEACGLIVAGRDTGATADAEPA